MSEKKKVVREYQQSMIDAYYDLKMHELLDPLYDAFLLWRKVSLTHDELNELIHKAHRKNQRLWGFLRKRRAQWFPASNQMKTGFATGHRIIRPHRELSYKNLRFGGRSFTFP